MQKNWCCSKIDVVNMTLYWGLINKDKEGKKSGMIKNWLSSKINAVSSDAVSRFHCIPQQMHQLQREDQVLRLWHLPEELRKDHDRPGRVSPGFRRSLVHPDRRRLQDGHRMLLPPPEDLQRQPLPGHHSRNSWPYQGLTSRSSIVSNFKIRL